jgi:hypothetical protein
VRRNNAPPVLTLRGDVGGGVLKRPVVAGAIDYSSFGAEVPAQQSESATPPIRYGHPLRTIFSFDADRPSFELT